MDSNTDIHGGNNQLLPNATHAVQHNNYYYEKSQMELNPSVNEQLQGEYRLYVRHASVNVPKLIRNARNLIVLHAAYYPKYGLDEEGKVLLDALENNPHLKLHAIFTDTEDNPWIDEFAKVLRDFIPTQKQKEVMRLSKEYFMGMKEHMNGRD